MFDAMFTISAVIYIFILCILLVLYWYRCLYEGPYKQFPMIHVEAKLLLKSVLEKGPMSRALFQIFLWTGKKYQTDGVCVVRIFRHFVLIFGEEFSKVFFNETAVVDKSSIYYLIDEVLGNGLLGSKGNVWKIHRKILNPGFSMSYITGKIPIFNRNAHELVNTFQSIEGVPSEDVEGMLSHCTFSILTESVLGFKSDDEKMGPKVKKFMKSYNRGKEIFMERISRPWLYPRWVLPWFKIGREHIEVLDYLRLFTNEVIQEMKKSLPPINEPSGEETHGKKSIAQILVEEHMLTGNLTMEDVADHVRTFMMAGYDTVYIALTWCLYELGHHPEVQETLYEEIQSVVQGKDVSYQELGHLKYTECVLKETLRLFPSIPLWGRKLSKDVQCGKYTVPKDSQIIFCPYFLHRNPDVYPNPYKFDPDRFLDSSDIRPWMHMPFAEGYRNCIGKRFAMLELKVLLAQIIRTYKVTSLCRVEENERDWRVLLKCTKKIKLLLTNRVSEVPN